jgi:Uncharacterized alpha/beta hydrolase domain (DUF2235)
MATKANEIGLKSHDDGKSNPKEASSHPVEGDEAVLNLFFDGTGNNIFNTRATGEQKLKDVDSFGNAATGTALMWEGIKDGPLLNPVYIDGIGTTRYQKDNKDGMRVGQGETGIPARAESAFPAIQEAFKENREGELPTRLLINVYGFSRGAATARHFIHLFNTQTHHPKTWPTGKNAKNWRINFVGLFDCVSSFEPKTHYIVGGRDFNNDVEELHLNFGEGYAIKVFHLIAGDEYRENFSVTTIASAGDKGHELTIPGAHSDVGGSYNAEEQEVRVFNDYRMRNFVYAQGWYNAGDRAPTYYGGHGSGAHESAWHSRTVKGEYSKVGHSIMADKANAHFKTEVFKQPSPPADKDVLALQAALRAFAKDSKNTRWDLNTQMPAQAQAIRHKFFHVSFQSSIGLGARTDANGLPVRLIIPG